MSRMLKYAIAISVIALLSLVLYITMFSTPFSAQFVTIFGIPRLAFLTIVGLAAFIFVSVVYIYSFKSRR